MNDNMARYAARNVIKLMINNGIDVSKSKVGVLGITFKEDCPDIRNSKVVDLIKEFEKWGVEVVVTDPYANSDEVFDEYGLKLSSIENFPLVDALVVAVSHKKYRELNFDQLRKLFKSNKPVLADLKAIYDKDNAASKGFTLFRF